MSKRKKDARVPRGGWMEFYKNCGCSFVARRRRELMGYCKRHLNNRRMACKLPGDAPLMEDELGHAGV